MPPTINLQLDQSQAHIDAEEPRILAGRDPSCRLVTEDPSVSRRHAELILEGGTLYLRDLGSSNGTFIGENKLNPNEPVELHPGDEIVMGKSKFRLEAVS
jgi:pSer/pThr/pTyr-binding forkhead associated (FHA) protein